MAVYHVYLVDIQNAIGSDERRAAVKQILKDYFDKVCKAAKITEGCSVQFVDANPQAAPHELIMYFITQTPHIVLDIKTDEPTDTIEASTGLTRWNNTENGSDMVASESMSTGDIANITFHEFMHQKLHLKDVMHKKDGIAGSPDNSLSAQNIKDMAAALKKKHPQWVGGFSRLTGRKNGDILN